MTPAVHPDGIRTVTVLFTDLVGSTELFARLGADGAERARERHFALLRRSLSAHDGHEVKTLGDGLMAVFESAAGAVGCAAAMQLALADENERRGEGSVAIRVGISSGDALVGGGDYHGEPVTEASRLCAAAGAGQILAAQIVSALLRGRGDFVLREAGALDLKGLPEPVQAYEVVWQRADAGKLRVVLADDAVLVREGVARLLEECGIEVVAQVGDADELMRCVDSTRPDVAITDVRMPPTNTTEGIDAAERIRGEYPAVAVLVLSQHLEPRYARRLLSDGASGIGYLLKERVTDVEEFAVLVRRVASGEAVLDPAIAGAVPDIEPV